MTRENTTLTWALRRWITAPRDAGAFIQARLP
jgi:hypothetical protein